MRNVKIYNAYWYGRNKFKTCIITALCLLFIGFGFWGEYREPIVGVFAILILVIYYVMQYKSLGKEHPKQ